MKRACILALACLGAFGASALNVRDFGAVGDGVTDDTAAIQRAVDEASLTAVRLRIHIGGQVGDGPTAEVFFPRGTYLLDGAVAVTRDAVLRGEDGAGGDAGQGGGCRRRDRNRPQRGQGERLPGAREKGIGGMDVKEAVSCAFVGGRVDAIWNGEHK